VNSGRCSYSRIIAESYLEWNGVIEMVVINPTDRVISSRVNGPGQSIWLALSPGAKQVVTFAKLWTTDQQALIVENAELVVGSRVIVAEFRFFLSMNIDYSDSGGSLGSLRTSKS